MDRGSSEERCEQMYSNHAGTRKSGAQYDTPLLWSKSRADKRPPGVTDEAYFKEKRQREIYVRNAPDSCSDELAEQVSPPPVRMKWLMNKGAWSGKGYVTFETAEQAREVASAVCQTDTRLFSPSLSLSPYIHTHTHTHTHTQNIVVRGVQLTMFYSGDKPKSAKARAKNAASSSDNSNNNTNTNTPDATPRPATAKQQQPTYTPPTVLPVPAAASAPLLAATPILSTPADFAPSAAAATAAYPPQQKATTKKRTFSEALAHNVYLDLVQGEVRRRRLSEALSAAVVEALARDIVVSRLPRLGDALARTSHASYDADQGFAEWGERVASQPLRDEDEAVLRRDAGWKEEDYTSTVAAASGGLLRRDLHTLMDRKWLNDAVLDGYLRLVTQRAEAVGGGVRLPRCHSMGTQFFQKLQGSGCDYEQVRRWTSKVDLFAYDIVLVPVNVGRHWALVAVDFAAGVITFYDSLGSDSEALPEIVRMWLGAVAGWARRDRLAEDIAAFRFELPGASGVMPQQRNSYDCGVFVCMAANCVAARRPLVFTQDDMPYLRRRVAFELLAGKVVAAP